MKVWKFLLTCVSKLAAFYFKTITLFTGITTSWLGKRRQKNVKILWNKTKLKTSSSCWYVFVSSILLMTHLNMTCPNLVFHHPLWYPFQYCWPPYNLTQQWGDWWVDNMVAFWLVTMQLEYFNSQALVRIGVISILSLQLSCQHGLGLILIESAPYYTTH